MIILLIFSLPFPQRINRAFCGVNTENGEEADIILDMTYLRFLLLKDKMYGTIEVKTKEDVFVYGEYLSYTGQSHSVNNSGAYTYDFSGRHYNETMYMKEYEDGTVSKMPVESLLVHISQDFSKILILHNTDEKNSASEKEQIYRKHGTKAVGGSERIFFRLL